MACISYTLSGLTKECETNIGGIKTVYIAPVDYVSAVTGTKINSEGDAEISNFSTITGITMSGSTKFKGYYFRKNTGSMTKTLNVTDEGGNYISTEISLRFSKMNSQKRLEMRALSLNDMAVIVKDCNDEYWYLGTSDDPVTASAGGGETGTNREDSNAYTITLSNEAGYWPVPVTKTAVEAVIAE